MLEQYVAENKVSISMLRGIKAAFGPGGLGMRLRRQGSTAVEDITAEWLAELDRRIAGLEAATASWEAEAALVEMMGLSSEQAEGVKEHECKLISLGRRGTPQEVARWVVALADPAADWITGQIISVDGGLGIS
jgi:hypothetical protein